MSWSLKTINSTEWIRDQVVNLSPKIIVSDEAHFHFGGFVNYQNCHIRGLENPTEFVGTEMNPQKITVWCAFWSGDVIDSFLFEDHAENAVTVNGVRYRNTMTEFFWEQLKDMDIENFWFQQHGASCHTAGETIQLLCGKLTIQLLCGKFLDRIFHVRVTHQWAVEIV